jgi:hypothetical protein
MAFSLRPAGFTTLDKPLRDTVNYSEATVWRSERYEAMERGPAHCGVNVVGAR